MMLGLDVDGTLVDKNGIPFAGCREIWSLRGRGVRTALCTARGPRQLDSLIMQFGPVDYMCCFQGALIIRTNAAAIHPATLSADEIYSAPLDRALLSELLSLVDSEFEVWAHSANSWYAESDSSLVDCEIEATGSTPTILRLREIPESIYKVVFAGAQPWSNRLAELSRRLPSGVYATLSHPHILEVVSAVARKDKGLSVAALDCGEGEVVAVGDSHNDLAMLASARRSFSFRDAPDAVRARASYILGSPSSGGLLELAQLIHRDR